MSIGSQGHTRHRRADVPDELPGIIMMLGLIAVLCILAALFI